MPSFVKDNPKLDKILRCALDIGGTQKSEYSALRQNILHWTLNHAQCSDITS
jgi:hypothetical protein